MDAEKSAKKLNDIVHELMDLTSRHKIAWHESARDDCFIAPLEHGSVEIWRRMDFPVDSPREVDWFELTLLNPKGRVIEAATTNKSLAGHEKQQLNEDSIASLFRLARAQALGSENVIDDLLGELHSLANS